MANLDNGRYVVTGATSGIGLEVARSLAARGAQVCLVGRRLDVLKEVVEELGGGAWSHACDLGDPAQVDDLVEAVNARWDGLEGLVNNAGIAPMASLQDTDLETWNKVFDINTRGPYLLTRGLLQRLRSGTGPSVVNVSSSLAEKAIAGMAAYNASKAALNQLTRSLALEEAPGIRVNAVMPAVVDTPIHADRGMSAEDVQSMGAMHPMGRVGTPQDLADMILFLLSDQSAWMTGALIPVDGGLLAT